MFTFPLAHTMFLQY